MTPREPVPEALRPGRGQRLAPAHAALRGLLLAGLMVLALAASHGRPGLPVFREGARRADGAVCLVAPPRGASAQNPLYVDEAGTLVYTLFHRGYNRGPAGLFHRAARGGPSRALLDEPDADSVNMPGSAVHRDAGGGDGAVLVFSSDREEREDIWTLGLAGGGPRRVTRHGDGSAFREPTWSPDGRWIVFERHEPTGGDGEGRGSLWKVRADGSGLVRLGPGPEAGWDDREPSWSPAGGSIVFQRRRAGSGTWNLHLCGEDGRNARALTRGEDEDTDPAWSPDGRRIAFSSSCAGSDDASIHVIDARGGGARRVTHVPGARDAAPCWSLDGAGVAFESRGRRERNASLWRIGVPRP